MINWQTIIEISKSNNNLDPDQRITKTDAQWRDQLSEAQYRIARQHGTERSFSHPMCESFAPGRYACVCCGQLLFDAQEKFDSGTGWPSFTLPIKENAIAYHYDDSHGMIRVEVTCNSCDSHLGHVFPDGPPPSGLRYCINGTVLQKVTEHSQETSNLDGTEEQGSPSTEQAADSSTQSTATAIFGGGCFWCTEALFQRVRGVVDVQSGYCGGKTDRPTYYQVCSGETGHAEVIQITYDPNQISFSDLVLIHLCTHDPTTLNRQGADTGTQYRSIIFYKNEQEQQIAKMMIAETELAIKKHVVTQVEPIQKFYPAEPEHQNYYNRNRNQGYCVAVIAPKLGHLEQHFKKLLAG